MGRSGVSPPPRVWRSQPTEVDGGLVVDLLAACRHTRTVPGMYTLTAVPTDPARSALTAAEALQAVWRGELRPEDVRLRLAEAQVNLQNQTQDDSR